MLELHVLGTSSARFTRQRSVSGSVLNTPGGTVLIDCGEGMQQRMLLHNSALKSAGEQARTRVARVRAILLTHGHLDHTWGVLPMLQTMGLDGRKDPLTIIGPSSRAAIDWAIQHPGQAPPPDGEITASDLAILYSVWQSLGSKDEDFGFAVDWVLLPMDEAEGPFTCPVQPLEGMSLTVVPTLHGVPSCGYQVASAARAGKFNRAKAESAGLSAEEVKMLARGEDVEVDGTTHLSVDFRGPSRPPRSILVSGDTMIGVPGFAKGALASAPDLLVHEATFTADQQEKATLYHHATAADAARHAASSGARALALTHWSSRLERLSTSVSEAREIWPGPVAAICDGDRFIVAADGGVTHRVRTEDGWNTMLLAEGEDA